MLIDHLHISFIFLQTWFYEKFHIDRNISYFRHDKPLNLDCNEAKVGKVRQNNLRELRMGLRGICLVYLL
uniref:Uncharacterized protein n=1 Tax=Aegilops tauschii subsp. strangulata TaxID=200361 RepID=A0A453MP39_AEGTS